MEVLPNWKTPHALHFQVLQIAGFRAYFNTKNFSRIQPAAENLRLSQFRVLQFLEHKLQLLHDLPPHTPFQIFAQASAMPDKRWKHNKARMQKKKKKSNCCSKKNINAVATLITEKGGGGGNPNVFYSDWETRRQPRLPPRCSLTSPPSMCSCVAAVSSRAGRCERHHSSKCSVRKAAREFTAKTSRYLRTPLLVKVHGFGLIRGPRAPCSEQRFSQLPSLFSTERGICVDHYRS